MHHEDYGRDSQFNESTIDSLMDKKMDELHNRKEAKLNKELKQINRHKFKLLSNNSIK